MAESKDSSPVDSGSPTSTTKAAVTYPRFWELNPEISIFNFNTLELPAAGETFSYADSFSGVSMITFNLAAPLGAWRNFEIFGIARTGYGMKGGEVPIDALGNSESIELHTIPIELLAKIRYIMPDMPSVRPALTLGAGSQLFFQSARNETYSKSYLIPNLIVGLNLGLFDPGTSPIDWFGGLTFGVHYHYGLDPNSRLRAMSFNLGVVVLL